MSRTFLMLVLMPAVAWAGGRAGNGFAVYCDASPKHKIEKGYYSLDYLATLGLGESRPVNSWKDSASRIRKLIQAVLEPDQLALYDDFVSNVRNKDYSRKRVWEAAPFGVINLKSQAAIDNPRGGPVHKEQRLSNLRSLVTELPASCKSASGDVEAIPAVVFQDHFFTGRPRGSLVYKFVPQVLDRLEVTGPLQLSYLYVHEWLWDVSNSEDRNRRLNHLFHSKRIEKLSTEDLRRQVRGMGLGFSSSQVADSAARTALNRTTIPKHRLPFAEVKKKLQEDAKGKVGTYQVFAVVRDCPKEGECGVWKTVRPHWRSLRDYTVMPEEGEIFFQKDAEWILEVRSPRVDTSRGRNSVLTECPIDRGDTQLPNGYCRRMWVPAGDLAPLGQLFVGGVMMEMEAHFTEDGLWIGGHGKNHLQEARVALVMPYQSRKVRASPVKPLHSLVPSSPREFHSPALASKRLDHWPLPHHEYGIDNGVIRRTYKVPLIVLPKAGIFEKSKVHTHYLNIENRGQLEGLRANIVMDRNWDNLGFKAYSPTGAKYGYFSDASPRTTDCSQVRKGKKVCSILLQPGFGESEIRGDWKFEFTFDPKQTPAEVYSVEVVLEYAPRAL